MNEEAVMNNRIELALFRCDPYTGYVSAPLARNSDPLSSFQAVKRLDLFLKQVRLALSPRASKMIKDSCLEGCDFAEEDLENISDAFNQIAYLISQLEKPK